MKIDPEFRALIAPLQPEERAQLEANLQEHGCRDPLVVWRGTLIDGHNRYEICERLRIRYRTVEIALPSREHVLLWIEENQLGRRNLTDDQRSVIGRSVEVRRLAIEEHAKKQRAREVGKLGGRGHKSETKGANVAPSVSHPTRKIAAKAAGVSEHKLRQVREIEKKKPAAIPSIRSGEKTIKQVKAEIRNEEKAKVRAAIAAEAPRYPDGPFRVLVVDPPWKYGSRAEDPSHRAANPYPDMTLEEMKDPQKIAILKLAHEHCVLWLWTTNAFMRDAFALLDHWGFEQKTILTWVKDRMGLGDWLRGQTEHCLMAVRGRPVIHLTNQTTALVAPMREHSRKPEAFYRLIESLCPGNRCELFARERRDGWESWGAEKDRFEAVS